VYLGNGKLERTKCLIRFGFKLGKNIMGTYEVLKIAYGEQTVERPLSFEWFSKYDRCAFCGSSQRLRTFID
jgi:hypothetical protein